MNNNLYRKLDSYYSIKNKSNIQDSKIQKISLKDNHRSSVSNDLPLSLEMGSMINVNKNLEEENNESNININKNKMIRVNTKRNKYKNLSILSPCKTKKKFEKNNRLKNYEENELFKDISGIKILKHNKTNSEKYIYKQKKEYNIERIIYIQKWWKNILLENKKRVYSILSLIKCIKRIYLINEFNLIKNNFLLLRYFFHKFNNIINKSKIFYQFLNYKKKIQSKKFEKKNNNIKLSDRKSAFQSNKTSKKNSKDKCNKGNKILNKKKFISIAINGDNSKNKDTNYYYSTKQNKKINFIYLPNNNTNKKKSQPYSPKAISITERNTSPLNNIEKKLKIKQSFTSKDLCKNNSNIAKKSNDKIKLNLNKIIKKENKGKRNKKKLGEKIINQKIISNLDIIRNNDSISLLKNESKSIFEENSSFFQKASQFNNYIFNINKKDNSLFNHYQNHSKDENKINKLIDDFHLINNSSNNKGQHFFTESNISKVNSLFKKKICNSNSKIYGNCLYKGNRYHYYNYQNINTDNIIVKRHNNIPIGKNVKVNKNGKFNSNKKFSSYKKNLGHNYSKSISTGYIPINQTFLNYSKDNSIDNTSIKKMKKNNTKLLLYIYFNHWEEYTYKKIILKKMTKFLKFKYYINHYKNIILFKNIIHALIKIGRKPKIRKFFIKMMFKMMMNILKKLYEYKRSNMKEIKIIKKNKYNKPTIPIDFNKEKLDIINNININNYIHYDDYKLFQKRKARSPNILTKIKDFKTDNNYSQYNYYNSKLSLSNCIADKINDNNQLIKNNNIREHISLRFYNDKLNKNLINYNQIFHHNNSGFINHKIIDQYNTEKVENGVIVDQINQLKMVFNLLERHNFKSNNNQNNKSYSLLDYFFNKWKLISMNNICKTTYKKLNTPKISEKIINLKPYLTSKNSQNSMNNNQNDISLKKNLSLNKISPKIINVINVQNYNENNNYNYNFKYMPIKDIPIYPQKQRNSYDYNNIGKINTEINNLKQNENIVNTNINNNNYDLNTTSFLMLNDNKHINPNIVYHKKKLGPTFINNNYNLNFNNNIDNIINNHYKLDKKRNNNSSVLLYDKNQSGVLLPNLNNNLYLNYHNNETQTIFRENSFNNLRPNIYKDSYPGLNYGFKKINKIEEKEVNFFESAKNKKNIYIKKQHYDTSKNKIDINNQNNIKTNLFKNNDIENNNKNLIKCLNIQFGKTNKVLIKKTKNVNEESYKYITISEDNSVKNKIIDNKRRISLTKKSYKEGFDNNSIKSEFKANINKTIAMMNKLNKITKKSKSFICEFDYNEHICKKKTNRTFMIYHSINDEFKNADIKLNHISL